MPQCCPGAAGSGRSSSPWTAVALLRYRRSVAYPGNFFRLVVEGAGYDPERWSWSLNLARTGVPDFVSPPDRVPPAIEAAVRKFHQTPGMISSRARLDTIKFNAIGPDGRYLASTETVRRDLTNPVSGSGDQNPFPQLALAVTLLTDRARGRGSRGRFYPPYPNFGGLAAVDGLLTTAQSGLFANAAATLVNELNAATDETSIDVEQVRVVVASDLGAGVFAPVTSVQVGRTMDTMRSRRTSLPEQRVPSDVAITTPT